MYVRKEYLGEVLGPLRNKEINKQKFNKVYMSLDIPRSETINNQEAENISPLPENDVLAKGKLQYIKGKNAGSIQTQKKNDTNVNRGLILCDPKRKKTYCLLQKGAFSKNLQEIRLERGETIRGKP